MDRLPDGGPLRVQVTARGLDIGRDAHLDWTLPDPSRFISSKHCEIRYRENDYWLFDVSTNGTFVNGAQFRLDAPYRLRDRDRLTIGPYIVAVSIDGGADSSSDAQRGPGPAVQPPAGDFWGGSGEVAPPDDRDAYRVRNRPAIQGDFLDFATDAGLRPSAGPSAPSWRENPPPADESWLTASPPPPPAPPPPLPPHELPRVERPRPARPPEPAPPAPDPRSSYVVEPPPAAPFAAGPRPSSPFAAGARRPQSFGEAPPPAPLFAEAPSSAAPPDTPAPSPFVAKPQRPMRPQPPPPPPEPAPPPSRSPPPAPAPSDFGLLDRIAFAAGIPKEAIAGRNPQDVADEIGAILRLTAHNLVQMAASRRDTKSAIRSTRHTTYKPTENNPIKFAASPEHAMEIMFGPPNRIHMRGPDAVAQTFEELKTHNLLTFGAMQSALDALFEDLAPDRIEGSTGQERGLSAMMASRKARLWDVYAERWRSVTKRADGRLNDAFMTLFAQAYDRLSDKSG